MKKFLKSSWYSIWIGGQELIFGDQLSIEVIFNNLDGINFVDFFELAKGDTIPKGVFRNKPNVSPNDEITVLFSSEDYSLRATGNSSGSGYIYNLMTSVRDNNTASPEMLGYTKIPVDLNEGAGGYWIYLYYKKSLIIKN